MAKLNHPTEGTKRHLPTLAKMQRAGCRVLRSASRPEMRNRSGVMGGDLLLVETRIPLSNEEVIARVASEVMYWFSRNWGTERDVLAWRLMLEDVEATAPGSEPVVSGC